MEEVILVDAHDQPIGTMEKLEAHQKGLLHRAFSVILFNSKGEMLLQKRATDKYHSGGLWTNTCCSHPKPDESIEMAAERRLEEEMGIRLRPAFLYKFIYKTPLDNELTEHELDHVLTGVFDGEPAPHPSEVADWKYVAIEEIKADMAMHPDDYTFWFRLIMENIGRHLNGKTPETKT